MSGGPKKPKTQKDNLFSQDIVELALSFGEGVIWGLEKGLESFYIGEEAALDMSTGTPFYPFPDFSLSMRQGYVDDLPVEFILGGEANIISGSSGTTLTENIPRSFETSPALRGKIRALDIRFAVQSLYSGDAEGNTSQRSCVFKIEYKRSNSDPEFQPLISKHLNDLLLSSNREDYLLGRALFLGYSEPEFKAFTPAQLDLFEERQWQIRESRGGGDRSIYTRYVYSRSSPTNSNFAHITRVPLVSIPKPAFAFNHISDAGEAANFLVNPFQYHMIYGKTTSGYISELRIPLDLLPEDTLDDWQLRITRLTKTIGADDAYNAVNISLDSIATVAEEKVSYPRICAAHILAQHTDRFSQIPDFSCDLMGLLCDIPTNYNGFEGTYSGVWLGGYKKAWTDNPVWILRELIMNPDWGDRSREPSIQISDSSFYEAAQYCDQRVPKLNSAEMIRRHTLNMVVQEYRTSDDLKKFIAGSFRSILNEVNGKYYLNTDKERPLSFFVSPEMVSSELFIYSATDLASRFNFMRVSFQNKENKYQEDNRVITNQSQIDKYGVISNDFQAVGVTNLDEALRQGVFNMLTNLNETVMVNFKIPRLGMFIGQYDNFLIADRTCGWGDSGRVFEQKGNLLKVLTPISAGAGACELTYHTNSGLRTVDCNQLDPYTFEISLLEEFVFLERDTPFILSSVALGSPKVFRLMSVKDEGQGDGLIYTVEASEVYVDKYSLTDALDSETLGLQFAADRLIYTARPRPPKPIAVSVVQLDFLAVGSSAVMYEITITMADVLAGYRYQVIWYHSDFATESEKKTVILDSPQGVLAGEGLLSDKDLLSFEVSLIDSFGNAGETFYLLNQDIEYKIGYEQITFESIETDLEKERTIVRWNVLSTAADYSEATLTHAKPKGVIADVYNLNPVDFLDPDPVSDKRQQILDYAGLGFNTVSIDYSREVGSSSFVQEVSEPLRWLERIETFEFATPTLVDVSDLELYRISWTAIEERFKEYKHVPIVYLYDETDPEVIASVLNPADPYQLDYVDLRFRPTDVGKTYKFVILFSWKTPSDPPEELFRFLSSNKTAAFTVPPIT